MQWCSSYQHYTRPSELGDYVAIDASVGELPYQSGCEFDIN